jgi:hypothetical protein
MQPNFSDDVALVKEWSNERIVAAHYKNSITLEIMQRAFAAIEYVMEQKGLTYKIFDITQNKISLFENGVFQKVVTVEV